MDSAIGGFLVADIRGVNSKAVFGIFARVGVTRAGESPREVLRPPDPEKHGSRHRPPNKYPVALRFQRRSG